MNPTLLNLRKLMEENQNNQQLDGGTYEIIQSRLQKQKQELQTDCIS